MQRPREANVFNILLLVSARGSPVDSSYFLFKSGRNLFFHIHKLLVIRWSPNEMTKHQGILVKFLMFIKIKTL